MGKINILSEELCNRIAAGEVIDRPYSVVKELVENSIDAGATEIEIYIEDGGKNLIKVIDNGCGIEKDDMREAFFSHATSKITALEDIEHIHTLGFRGEALATIAAVSEVELLSSVDGQNANRVFCDGEFIGKVEPAVAVPKGTQITVKKLFFNTPVRLKFLKTDKKEENDISNYVIKYILGRPDISFKYYVNGKLNYQSYGGGLDEAITQVFGADYLPKCFKISADRNNLKMSGFISNQEFFKSNKTFQYVYLNGRSISNPIISSAISNAYAPYIFKKQYPFYVLFIEIPDEIVDINVHPNKQDVRFVDNQLIYGTIYKIISSILDGSVKASDYVLPDDATAVKKTEDNQNAASANIYAADYTVTGKIYDKDFSDVVGIEKYGKVKDKPATVKQEEQSFIVPEDMSPSDDAVNPEKSGEALADMPLYKFYGAGKAKPEILSFCAGIPEVKKPLSQDEIIEKRKQESMVFKECKYRGTLFHTYIIYEKENDVYLIDQHAAHERLIYDSLIEKLNTRKIARQGMLMPYIFIVTPDEKRFLEENNVFLWDMGFSIEPFGINSFRVNDVPADLPGLNLEEFFNELLASVGELKKIALADVVKDKIAQTACKHAVKGGDILTEQERDALFAKIENNLDLRCPHGRPVTIKLTKTEIEKMFKRKV